MKKIELWDRGGLHLLQPELYSSYIKVVRLLMWESGSGGKNVTIAEGGCLCEMQPLRLQF